LSRLYRQADAIRGFAAPADAQYSHGRKEMKFSKPAASVRARRRQSDWVPASTANWPRGL